MRAMRAPSIITTCGLLFAVMLGCETRVSLGGRCEVASDCPAPYACRAGRCRSECLEARDCPYPLECLLVGGVGGCRVAEDGACPGGTTDCGDGLECIAGRCAQPCEGPNDCAAAQSCAATACERPTIPAGTCDAVSGAGCGAGERCNDADECEPLVGGAAATQGLHDSCDATRACRDGLDCRVGRCVRRCRVEGDVAITSCAEGSRCVLWDESGAPAPEGLGFCTQACDPADATSCPSGLGCGVDFLDGNTTLTSCELVIEPNCAGDPSEDGCPFQACDMNNRCVAGTDCLETLSQGDIVPALCIPFCDESGTCPTGSTCMRGDFSVHYTLGGEELERGLCMPTCDVADGLCEVPDELPVTCDSANPRPGGIALCTQECTDDTECFALFRCDTSSGHCTPRRPG